MNQKITRITLKTTKFSVLSIAILLVTAHAENLAPADSHTKNAALSAPYAGNNAASTTHAGNTAPSAAYAGNTAASPHAGDTASSAAHTATIRVAITIDDLPSHSELPQGLSRQEVARQMVDTLKAEKIAPVYGFINAAKSDADPALEEVLKIWRESGNLLGNHTYSHRNLNKATIEDFETEIDRNEATLKKYAGSSDWHYFRYPYLIEGDTLEKKNAVRNYLAQRSYKIAEVTVDFEDWSWNEPYARCLGKKDQASIEWLKATYLRNAVNSLKRADEISKKLFHRSVPHILLLHIGAFDAQMLGALIHAYRDNGVDFIPLETAQKDEIYTLNPQATFDRGAELIFQVMKEKGMHVKDLNLRVQLDYPETELQKLCR